MKQNIGNIINEIFYNIQFNKTCHQKNLKKLKKIYEECELSVFLDCFMSCLKVPLSITQHHSRVNNTLEFAAKFAVGLYSVTDNDEESEESLCPFLSNLLNFILIHHCAKNPGVRYRICHFLNILLNAMGDQASIDDEICENITISMMSRLLDKSHKVRAQAIFALHRLQDPSNDECPVIKMYIFHATKDPKAEVRKAALMSMGKNQKTLQVALRRTRDTDETVRKVAYVFISKVTVRSLTITQRDQLLNDGLKDRSEMVRKTVQNVLLPSWLRHFKGNFTDLVKALDAEIGTDVSILALESLFKNTPTNQLIEQLPIDNQTKLIPINNLLSENVLYWRCLVKYFHRECLTEEVENILPELSVFCTYISDFLTKISENQNKTWENHMMKFILLQLFEIATAYDLSDEVGRNKLNQLICNTLMSNHCTESIIECIVTHLQKVIPDVNSRLDTLANVISEIRLPLKETQTTQISEQQQQQIPVQRAKLKMKVLALQEEEYQAIQEKEYLKADALKNQINEVNKEIQSLTEQPQITVMEEIKEKSDPETMRKCLSIICTMMQSVVSLTPTLRSLMQIAFDSLEHPDDTVHILAIQAVSICCILDKELAKQHLMMLVLQFSLEQENANIWIIALKGIFDLLLLYGLEHFDILEYNEERSTSRTEKSHTTKLYTDNDTEVSLSSTHKSEVGNSRNFIKILAGLLDHPHQGLRTIAAEGLCKLLLNQRISSSNVLSKLIILCFNPINDNDFYLRQCLSVFFDNFVTRVPESHELLEQAYLPTLKILCKAPEISPLKEIDPYDVSRFILNLTRFVNPKSGVEHYRSHNNFAFMILAEILNRNSKIEVTVLIRSLKDLCIEIDDNTSKENIREAINKITEMINASDKRLIKNIEVFKKKLEAPNSVPVQEDEDIEVED